MKKQRKKIQLEFSAASVPSRCSVLPQPCARCERLCHRSDCGAASLPCRPGADKERLSPLCAALLQCCLPLGSRETLQVRPFCHGGTMVKEELAGLDFGCKHGRFHSPLATAYSYCCCCCSTARHLKKKKINSMYFVAPAVTKLLLARRFVFKVKEFIHMYIILIGDCCYLL